MYVWEKGEGGPVPVAAAGAWVLRLCVYVYVYVCMLACEYWVCVYVCVCMYVCMYVCWRVSNAFVYMCMHVSCVCMCVCVYVLVAYIDSFERTRICMYTCRHLQLLMYTLYTYMYVYIHASTAAHVYIYSHVCTQLIKTHAHKLKKTTVCLFRGSPAVPEAVLSKKNNTHTHTNP
jgi:hypothetical protein